MPKRFISRRAPIVQRHLIPLLLLLRRAVALSAPQRTLHPLILIRDLRIAEPAAGRRIGAVVGGVALDAVAAAAAAAGAEEPEEAGGEGEGDAEPEGDVHVVAEGAVDVVFGEGVVEGGGEGGVEDRGGEGEADEEEGTDG